MSWCHIFYLFLLFCFVCIWIDKFVFVFRKWLLLCRKSVFYLSSFRQVVETDQQKSDIISPVYERPKEYGVKGDRYHFPQIVANFSHVTMWHIKDKSSWSWHTWPQRMFPKQRHFYFYFLFVTGFVNSFGELSKQLQQPTGLSTVAVTAASGSASGSSCFHSYRHQITDFDQLQQQSVWQKSR